MEFVKTEIPEVVLIKPKVFGDSRGYFLESYRRNIFEENGIPDLFVQDNLSKSRRGVVRGLHYQIENPQAKLVMVAYGEILDVAVDVRKNSPSFGKYVAVRLSSEKKNMLYIPIGFAHGFQVLSEEAVFQYKCSDYYNPRGERGIAWNDPEIGISWEKQIKPIISEKDQKHPVLSDVNRSELISYTI